MGCDHSLPLLGFTEEKKGHMLGQAGHTFGRCQTSSLKEPITYITYEHTHIQMREGEREEREGKTGRERGRKRGREGEGERLTVLRECIPLPATSSATSSSSLARINLEGRAFLLWSTTSPSRRRLRFRSAHNW